MGLRVDTDLELQHGLVLESTSWLLEVGPYSSGLDTDGAGSVLSLSGPP